MQGFYVRNLVYGCGRCLIIAHLDSQGLVQLQGKPAPLAKEFLCRCPSCEAEAGGGLDPLPTRQPREIYGLGLRAVGFRLLVLELPDLG